MRKRVEHSLTGKIVDIEISDRLSKYAMEVASKVCNEIATDYDILDIESMFDSSLGYAFALQLMRYSSKCDKE
jgi:hypothetical protein